MGGEKFQRSREQLLREFAKDKWIYDTLQEDARILRKEKNKDKKKKHIHHLHW